MIKLTDLLRENSSSSYSYGCVMLFFSFLYLKNIQNQINPSDIYEEDGDKTYGIEDEPHITLLYGLHSDVNLDEIKSITNQIKFDNLILHNVSLFNNPKYDVLKFDVKYPNKNETFLHNCNEKLKKLPHTTSFPTYHPHSTIGYLKPGKGKKYVDLMKDKEYFVKTTHIIYSTPEDEKFKIDFKRQN